MSVIGRLARAVRSSLEDPLVPLSSPRILSLFGGPKSAAGVHVTEGRAIGISAYYRALTLMAGTNAALPLKVYRRGTRERVLQRTVLDSPNPAQTPFEFWQVMYANALSWGTGYAQKRRNGAGIVNQVWPIHPAAVRPELIDPTPDNPAGKLFHVTTKKGVTKTFTPWEIFEAPYLSLHGGCGLAPLRYARDVLGIAIAADTSASTFYANGSQLSGILQTKEPLDTEAAGALKDRWRQLYSGAERAGEIAVLDNGADFKPIAIPPDDAQLLETRRFSVEEIGRLFGIPPHMLGATEKQTSWGTGVEQQTIGFVQFTLIPWLKLFEQRITRELLPGGWDSGIWFAEYSLDGLLRGDSASRAAFYHAGITDGWMNRNEARAYETLEPIEGLDEYLVPSNLTLVSVNGELIPLGGKGAGTDPSATTPAAA